MVGKDAKDMLNSEPEKAVSFIKREMGNDAAFDKSANNTPYHFDPSEISAFILKKLVKDANDANGYPEPIKDVVITCPAYFGNKERMQTKQAGIIAGLNVLAIINEPTAAAIAYGTKVEDRKTILVYDLGGGTFDVTIILVNKGAIKVIATGGDHHLGGVDWDTEVANWLLDQFNQKTAPVTPSTTTHCSAINCSPWQNRAKTPHAQVKGQSRHRLPRAVRQCRTHQRSLRTTHLKPARGDHRCHRQSARNSTPKGFDSIDEFLLVGGSCRMPQVKACVDQRYNVNARIGEVDEVVAKGAAIYAMNEAYTQAIQEYEEGERDSRPAPLRGDRAHVMNVTSKTYGLGIIDDQVGNVIFANSPLPTEVKTCEFSTNHDNQTGVNFNIYESDLPTPRQMEQSTKNSAAS